MRDRSFAQFQRNPASLPAGRVSRVSRLPQPLKCRGVEFDIIDRMTTDQWVHSGVRWHHITVRDRSDDSRETIACCVRYFSSIEYYIKRVSEKWRPTAISHGCLSFRSVLRVASAVLI